MRLNLAVACALLLAPLPARAAGDASYLQELQAQAREMRLAQMPQWHSLLHYRPRLLLPGVESLVDSKNFFATPEGRTDPQAELDATLRSFFSDMPRDGEPPQCRSKARYEWLKTLLRFDSQRLPEQTCGRYEKWLAAIDPGSLHIVFASSSLSSPATMFGHTLMRLDGRSQGPDRKLLSHAINYAAVYDEDDGNLFYAVRGIAGGYVGVFSMSPYYEKVNEYARIESRDLWEYPLKLEPDEVRRLLWHLWEMREVEFDYYFFDENCSYQLLSLIDVARPDLLVMQSFPTPLFPHAIPLDTLRVLMRKGLLGVPEYRPALAQRLKHSLSQLTEAQYGWVLAYADGQAELSDTRLSQAEPARRAALLDAAHDYLYYLFRDEALEREVSLPRAQQALRARSRLAGKSDLGEVPRPAASPDQGHESRRYSLGARVDRRGNALLLHSRDALHDLMDPSPGYLGGGQLEFLNLGILIGDDGARLADLKLVGVQSTAPWDRAFRPWSWFASTGARRYGLDLWAATPQHSLGFYAEGGGGITLAPLPRLQLFAYGKAQLDANPDLRENYSIALGPSAGAALQWADHWTQLTEAQYLTPVAGGGAHQVLLRSGVQWQWTPRLGLRTSFNYSRNTGESLAGGEVLLNYYF